MRRSVDVELLRRALRYRSLGRYREDAPESSGHRPHRPAGLRSKLRCFVAGRLPHQIDERFASATTHLCRGNDEVYSESLRKQLRVFVVFVTDRLGERSPILVVPVIAPHATARQGKAQGRVHDNGAASVQRKSCRHNVEAARIFCPDARDR